MVLQERGADCSFVLPRLVFCDFLPQPIQGGYERDRHIAHSRVGVKVSQGVPPQNEVPK